MYAGGILETIAMSIQLSMAGQPLLVHPTQSDCDIVVDMSKQYYLQEGERVRDTSNERNGILFALLSVQSPFAATVEAYRQLNIGVVNLRDKWAVYHTIVSSHAYDGVLMYPGSKAQYIGEWARNTYEYGINYKPFPTDMDYRDYLRKGIKGLAWAKSSFAVMCTVGLADVCCIDTHMHRLLTGLPARNGIPKNRYLQLEQEIRQIAQRHDIPCSVAQHALWDSMRGERSRLMP